jgi:hypothetical protein
MLLNSCYDCLDGRRAVRETHPAGYFDFRLSSICTFV